MQYPPLVATRASRSQQRPLREQIAGRIERLSAEAHARRAQQARRRRSVGFAAILAAALVAATLGVTFALRPRPLRPAAAQITALRGSVEIAAGTSTRPSPSLALVPLDRDEELRTGEEAMARASLATGATVEVGPSTRVRFTPLKADQGGFDDTIALDRGKISIEVPPLQPGVTLSVRTEDTVVTVHGTRFSVERTVDPGGGVAETRVAVASGRVSVQRAGVETLLGPGQSWTSREGAQSVAPGGAGGGAAPPAPAEARAPRQAPRRTLVPPAKIRPQARRAQPMIRRDPPRAPR